MTLEQFFNVETTVAMVFFASAFAIICFTILGAISMWRNW